MPILAEDSAEMVASECREAFDLVRPEGRVPGSQGCCGGEGSVGAVLVVVLLILMQRVVRAENYVHAGQGKWRYTRMTPPRRSCGSMTTRSI
ncbi:hypothetical protein GCM10017774_38050 [Lentzea cavernae]|uniref:Uncharacterized protein n=1 Tax=Lentzea cavernae TaxID=2020703 RepID=A0ABQ3MH98_9PSEU|nr:hypothetical protein GCM10017774_38050 [Lentzea cavernae]